MFHYITMVYIYIAIYHYGIYIYISYTFHLRYVFQHSIHFWWWHCHATSGKFQESWYFVTQKVSIVLTQEAALQQVQSVEAAQINSGSMPFNETRHTHTQCPICPRFNAALKHVCLWSFPEHCRLQDEVHMVNMFSLILAFSGAIMAGVESSLSSLCIS